MSRRLSRTLAKFSTGHEEELVEASSLNNAGLSKAITNGIVWGRGWMGGYYGYWAPILLLIVIGAVVWAILQNRK